MDGIIVLLIIIGFISKVNKNKKKREAAKKVGKNVIDALSDAAQKQPQPAKRKAQPVKNAPQVKIPFTKEEWAAFLKDDAPSVESKPKKAAPEGAAAHARGLGEGISAPLKSTQGESEAEHKRHLEKMAAAEAKRSVQIQTRRSEREMNRKKLREAMIMSEILAKPVALRPRGQR